MSAPATSARSRSDLCPGVLRPWIAEDGALVRLRLIGGRLRVDSLRSLLEVSATYGDGAAYLTSRANLQLRALPHEDGRLSRRVVDAIRGTGLLPHPSHELVRNVLVSPATGLAGGRADLRPVAAGLDDRLCAEPLLAGLSARFLFALDDGRGDLLERGCDLGLVALDADTAQLRVGPRGWGERVALADAPGALTDLALEFVRRRGRGPNAPWHVDELDSPLAALAAPHADLPAASEPLPFGPGPAGRHVEVPDGRLTVEHVGDWPDEVVVTPWRGVLLPVEAR